MNVHFFACKDGVHITLWRLEVYWLPHTCRYWCPWRSADGGALYFLRLCFEWTK